MFTSSETCTDFRTLESRENEHKNRRFFKITLKYMFLKLKNQCMYWMNRQALHFCSTIMLEDITWKLATYIPFYFIHMYLIWEGSYCIEVERFWVNEKSISHLFYYPPPLLPTAHLLYYPPPYYPPPLLPTSFTAHLTHINPPF